MSKMNCNVIKDLLPSYADDICSPESKTLVEEHFSECETCKKIYEQTILEIPHTDSSSSKEVDYFRKIKSNVSRKNAIIIVIIALLYILELYSNFIWLNFSILGISSELINLLFPTLVGVLLFAIVPDYTEHKVPSSIKNTVLGIECAAIAYIFLLFLYIALNKSTFGGVAVHQISPILAIQIFVLLMGFIIAFPVTLFLSIQKKMIYPALLFVPLSGIAFMFEYAHYLHEFSYGFSVSALVTPSVLLAIEVLALVGIYMFVNRKK